MSLERMRDVLRGSLGRSLRDLGPEDRLVAAWQVVCGAALAAHGTVSHLDEESVLHVRVDSQEWFEIFFDRRTSLKQDLVRIASVPLAGIHFEKARVAPRARAVEGPGDRKA
ncbi:MAG: DciA family protein [Acidobacteriaceae bacterium]|nr:DciA family protein [Acidobacteriaceae bacterium]